MKILKNTFILNIRHDYTIKCLFFEIYLFLSSFKTFFIIIIPFFLED